MMYNLFLHIGKSYIIAVTAKKLSVNIINISETVKMYLFLESKAKCHNRWLDKEEFHVKVGHSEAHICNILNYGSINGTLTLLS